MTPLARIAWIVVALAAIPAALLAAQRVGVEGESRRVAVVMDAQAIGLQADALGLDPFELALRYRDAGLPGVALYEDTIETAAARGRIAVLDGPHAIAAALARGAEPPPIPPDSTLVTALQDGALEGLLAKTEPAPPDIEFAGRTWRVVPGRGQVALQRPMGPDAERIERFVDAGFDVAWRPRNHPSMVRAGEDFPPQARYLVHAGLDIAGWPSALEQTIDASQPYLTAIIEGTEQNGLARLRGAVPTVRLLSFNQDYIDLRLDPDDLVEKYLLAANERNVRLLYLRPYTRTDRGPMVENTTRLVADLTAALEVDGFTIAPLPTGEQEFDFAPSRWLRAAAALGVLAALVLLALRFPGAWGALAALGVAGLGVFAGGFDWDALALVAALVFPVLGFLWFPRRPWALPAATGVSLLGALLLAGVGSDRAALLALEPFAGVGATLVVPPALFVAADLLRERRPAAWIRELWGRELRLGDVAVAGVAVAALGLVVIRRGNLPIIGASDLELAIRSLLSEWFVRPRFKELLGHPLALLGLAAAVWRWPRWSVTLFLAGGVVAQASILNSFSHYHTPLLVSLQRTVIAFGLGAALGIVLLPMARLTVTVVRRWLTPRSG